MGSLLVDFKGSQFSAYPSSQFSETSDQKVAASEKKKKNSYKEAEIQCIYFICVSACFPEVSVFLSTVKGNATIVTLRPRAD